MGNSFKILIFVTSFTLSLHSNASNAVSPKRESQSAVKTIFTTILQQSSEMGSSINRLISKTKSEEFSLLTREIPRLKLMNTEIKVNLEKAQSNSNFAKFPALSELLEMNKDFTALCDRLITKLNTAEYDVVKREVTRLKLMNNNAMELIGKVQASLQNLQATPSALTGEDAERIIPLLTRLISQLNQTRFLGTLKQDFLNQLVTELSSVAANVAPTNKRLKRQAEAAIQQVRDALKENGIK